MLKKIVKYGNSNALVLDKALLELLNMTEGSIVKIKTDGVSLIITPQANLAKESLSPTITPEDAFRDALQKSLEQSFGDPQKARAYRDELEEICSHEKKLPEMQKAVNAFVKKYSPEAAQNLDTNALMEEFAKVHAKYGYLAPALNALNENQEYLHELMLLTEEANSAEYLQARTKLIEKYLPEWAAYQEELKRVADV